MAVAIIGAGMAGLAAARELHARGVPVEMFEARDRIGGRAYDLPSHGIVPLQLGPEFVHGAPESTLALLDAARLPTVEITDTHHQPRDGQLAKIDDIWERFGDLLKPAARQRHDESARSYLERQHMSADDRRMFAMLVEGFYAAPLDDISIKSIAADASGAAGEDAVQSRVRGGYGALVAWFARELRGVPIHHGHVVRAIDWTGARVRIDGDFIADEAIVTVPIGVLRDIAFTPGLGAREAALDLLAMGPVVKLVVCFREPVWPRELEFVHGGQTGFPTYWLRSAFDSHVLTAWAGGPHARALAHCSSDQLVDRALAGFARLIDQPTAWLRDELLDHHHHDWIADPFARGAYSYTRVGGGDAAATLARPLGDRIWLAGEATDAEYEGTVAGALASGLRAAREILERHGVRVAA